MSRNVIWTEKALNDLREISDYWDNRNKSSSFSEKLYDLFLKALYLVSIAPKLGLPTDLDNVRIKLVRDYWIFYTYDDAVIIVLQIRSTHQRPSKYLHNKNKSS